jgi:ATP-dependent helicase HrpA
LQAEKLKIDFPESLPVSGKREEIARAITQHQVVIVCGETGSGKTTQLPKIALSLGRGKLNAAPGKGRLIGHTQPRRIAASSVAKRIAEELKTPLGEVVGYKVRFQDRLSRNASVKLMTDGILLAETQTDPDLKAYDTLIIDEAHERSLNIDFLLGYLKQLLPRRPDLKIIVTSATIDADRFAKHFESRNGPAPVILVSGRLYPVEQRYHPFEESKDFDLNDAIADAVQELWREPQAAGDILVFLPGEREIREAADHLRKFTASHMRARAVDVIPLFARLSQAEQDAVFEAHSSQRIVLATNVAETSLTVPGIRYVVDAGTARVKRYSYRSKVEQLQVEPVSQAAANQRAGRCGRVANGVCIRLYDEKDFASRARFTDPEILRSSLASVILRMKSLHLVDVEQFPFIEPPSGRAIADGYQLLQELGAVDEQNQLTALGEQLAKLPLDPRVGRMILAGRDNQALDEVLVIASALSVQDVRDRPLGQEAAADTAQKKFDDERSEFVGYLKLWKWLGDARGGHGKEHKLSNRQYENLLRQNFVSPRRVREWRDIHSQLLTVVTEQGWKLNASPATYEQLHSALLTGLLGNVGCKLDDDEAYLGARGIKFHRHPGSKLSKKPGRWVVAAELVETARLFARGMANIEPQWIERVGAHLLKKQLLDPHWEKKAAEVVALERATLYGIVIYNGRRKAYGLVDAVGAREIFIRQALVAGEWETKLPFLAHNLRLVKQVEDLEHKSRRQDVLVDDELIYAYYDAHVPKDVFSGHLMERWWREAARAQPKLLQLTREELMRHEAAGITSDAFPKTIRLGGVDCRATYLHEPGHAKDGVTVDVPLFVLNQVSEERSEWLVPGMLKDKVLALLKSLPQKPRARLVPLPHAAERISAELVFAQGGLLDALLVLVRSTTQLDVKRSDFKLDMLQAHHLMNIRVLGDDGRQLGMGRNLGALKSELGAQARGAFQALATLKAAAPPSVEENKHHPLVESNQLAIKNIANREPQTPAVPTGQRYTQWTFGELPELMEVRRGSQSLVGFPALVDERDAVVIEVFDEPEVAAQKHRAGLRRLFALQIKDALKYLEKNIPDLQKMSVAYMGLGTADELREQIIDVALERAFLTEPLPTEATSFAKRVDEGRARLNLIASEVARLAGNVLTEYSAAQRKIKDTKNAPEATQDVAGQLQRLMPKRFVQATPYAALSHFPRYLKAISLRLEKFRADPARDASRLAELRPIEQRFWRLVAERKGQMDARLLEHRWLLEELRVSLFAQELRTPQPVSAKRLDKAWQQLMH